MSPGKEYATPSTNGRIAGSSTAYEENTGWVIFKSANFLSPWPKKNEISVEKIASKSPPFSFNKPDEISVSVPVKEISFVICPVYLALNLSANTLENAFWYVTRATFL